MDGILIVTSVALIAGILITIIDAMLSKKEEVKKEKILTLLPGYNCGTCGFAGCQGMAEAITKNANNLKKCKPIKEEGIKKIEEYLRNNK